MAQKKKVPVRTCLGCQDKKQKRELIRIVRTPVGDIDLDHTGKANGRGTYICPASDCLDKALKKDRLKKALKYNVTDEDKERLKEQWEHVKEDE
ncbi:RNase P modulator RnpM [Natranaerobius trueperi]|uniref:Nucleic acid-binding protein n=1 Tax=Natranaerobius trueperi TaxID=759412 RepID=A0A226C0Z7_9FIRM|nr:YlxR family protein [Natranaerobius trueperi]OWZ84274.1 nucleic acid-binding protein [Natranaerobius trueperi]